MSKKDKYCSLWSVLLLLIVCGCTAVDFDDAEAEKSNQHLKIVTRSAADVSMAYPVVIYAFDAEGTLKGSQSLSSESENLSFPLAEGAYNLVAFSNAPDYQFPEEPSYSSFLSMPDAGYATEPLMIGAASVLLGGSSQTVNILMGYAVSEVSVSLSHVPESVKKVSITLSGVNTQRSFEGQNLQPKSITLSCVKEEEEWTTGLFYVFGSQAGGLTFSISLTDSEETSTYTYTYNGQLQAGTPYRLQGSYIAGLSVNGTLITGKWNDTVVEGFNFGPGSEQQVSEYEVDEIPEAPCIWNGHVVVLTNYITDTEAELWLMSLNEWTDMASAYHEKKGSLAEKTAVEYQEGSVRGWSIPSREQAQLLKQVYSSDRLQELSSILETAGGVPLMDEDESGTNVRYLCDEARSTFVFKTASSVLMAGAKTTTYRLRLVKSVRCKVKND